MDIPNLSTNPPSKSTEINFSITTIVIVLFLSITTGFWLSRFFPQSDTQTATNQPTTTDSIGTDKISSPEDIKVGQVYGNTQKNFNDSATGTIEKGSINGEGTHILNRPGGASQRASLTSSTVDLDLFIGKNVEVKGETNSSTKTSWLLDVGNLKVLE